MNDCIMWRIVIWFLLGACVTEGLSLERFSKGEYYEVPLQTKPNRNENIRGAIVLTLAGDKIPPYLDWSCNSIGASKSLFDLLIFHENNEALQHLPCATNVRKLNLGPNGLAKLIALQLARNADGVEDTSQIAEIYKLLSMVLRSMPYFLAEMKPATGSIFEDYLVNYSHWTYTDPDIIWGDVSQSISLAEMRSFDIISLAKTYDAQRLFLRGQFTLHKNEKWLNELWKQQSHMKFASVHRRMRIALSQLRKGRNEIVKRAVFVSAEGSYSSVAFSANASVLIAGRMYSDRTRTPVIWQDNRLHRCQCIPYQKCFNEKHQFDMSCAADEEKVLESYRLVVRQERTVTSDCGMGWMAIQHQRCLNERYNDVMYYEGRFFGNVEKYEARVRKNSAAMFHFRIWEDIYATSIDSENVKKDDDASCFVSYISEPDRVFRMHTCDATKIAVPQLRHFVINHY